jgi:hypothetical protein
MSCRVNTNFMLSVHTLDFEREESICTEVFVWATLEFRGQEAIADPVSGVSFDRRGSHSQGFLPDAHARFQFDFHSFDPSHIHSTLGQAGLLRFLVSSLLRLRVLSFHCSVHNILRASPPGSPRLALLRPWLNSSTSLLLLVAESLHWTPKTAPQPEAPSA